jgi:hypothetical protein
MSEILEEIDSWMEHIWLKVVKEEYDSSRILEESNLHSTVYPAPRKPRLMDGVRGLLSFEKINRKLEKQDNNTLYILGDAVLNQNERRRLKTLFEKKF